VRESYFAPVSDTAWMDRNKRVVQGHFAKVDRIARQQVKDRQRAEKAKRDERNKDR